MPNKDDLVGVLKAVCLDHLITCCNGLDSNVDWSCVISLGKQQQLAFARFLLTQLELALLDESTSALAEANEVCLYTKITTAGITYISVGHRRKGNKTTCSSKTI